MFSSDAVLNATRKDSICAVAYTRAQAVFLGMNTFEGMDNNSCDDGLNFTSCASRILISMMKKIPSHTTQYIDTCLYTCIASFVDALSQRNSTTLYQPAALLLFTHEWRCSTLIVRLHEFAPITCDYTALLLHESVPMEPCCPCVKTHRALG
jgi:hypothetical protein